MSEQFEVFTDPAGDFSVRAGYVFDNRSGAVFRVGSKQVAAVDELAPGWLPATVDTGLIFIGGSGRNLIVSGLPQADAPNGIWRPIWRNKWGLGTWTLVWDSVSGGAVISDGVDDVAVLASGGPDGTFPASTYGETTYNSSVAFDVTVALEAGWPGTLPDLEVTPSAGTAQGGAYTATDLANYVSAVDADWTLETFEDGTAEISYDGTVMASREAGPDAADPAGEYPSTEAGQALNLSTEDEEFEPVADPEEVSPYGTLTLRFEWTEGADDLGAVASFAAQAGGLTVAGAPLPDNDYFSVTADFEYSPPYIDIVIPLADAYWAGLIGDYVDIALAADSVGDSGTVTVTAIYIVGGAEALWSPLVIPISPGSAAVDEEPTPVAVLRIGADGSGEQPTEPWIAQVERRRVPPPEGVVYIKLVEVGGVPDSVEGPFFAATLPTPSSDTFYVPLAESDGLGRVEQVQSGVVVWP